MSQGLLPQIFFLSFCLDPKEENSRRRSQGPLLQISSSLFFCSFCSSRERNARDLFCKNFFRLLRASVKSSGENFFFLSVGAPGTPYAILEPFLQFHLLLFGQKMGS
ncbi:unnamed protein product [Coffea canephora]|uniref:Uncharacterized protein n=1 Tax=Coffea canephora TaxID=49390 RepID=A0A068V1S1_COFCA|nr:unnamed protein product [Coffea canephora]